MPENTIPDNTIPAPPPTPTPLAQPVIHPPDYEVVAEALQELYVAVSKFAEATHVFKETYVPTRVDFKPLFDQVTLVMLDLEQDITDSYAHILFKYGFEDDEDDEYDEDEEEDEDDDEYDEDEDEEEDEDDDEYDEEEDEDVK